MLHKCLEICEASFLLLEKLIGRQKKLNYLNFVYGSRLAVRKKVATV